MPKYPQVSILIGSLLLCVAALPAQARTRNDLRKADKIALALTGKPLPAELRSKFLSNQIELDGIADTLSKSADFIEYYAEFWTRTIGVQSPIDAYELRTLKDNKSIHDFANDNLVGVDRLTGAGPEFKNERPAWTVEGLNNWMKPRKERLPRVQIVNDCEDAPRIETYSDFTGHDQVQKVVEKGILPDGTNADPGTIDAWKEAYTIVKGSRAFCGNDGSGTIMSVWWDPEGVHSHARYKNAKGYRVPPWVAERCGPLLRKCSLNDASGSDFYMDGVNHDMSMEAGFLIAHTVAEDKPFTDILSSPNTIMTGRYAHFMGQWWGKNLWGNYPGGGIEDKDHPIFENAKVGDQKHYWIKRGGNLHAGVLTTPIFQAITNGRRAKANRAYETFLCRKFVVPDGAQPDPGDANPDLTKRAYCAYCHRSLEPMAAFFNRWPETGSTNFAYNPDVGVNDTGRFDGETGKGAAALGKILAKSDDFVDCSAKRAFQFTNGRKLTDVESNNFLADFRSTLSGSSMNMRTLIKKMVLSPDFLEPKEP